MCAR
jgi:large subunit ribosomal protein L6e